MNVATLFHGLYAKKMEGGSNMGNLDSKHLCWINVETVAISMGHNDTRSALRSYYLQWLEIENSIIMTE